MQTQALPGDPISPRSSTPGTVASMLRFLLFRFLPRRLMPLLMLLEVIRFARRMGGTNATDEDRRRMAAARPVGPAAPTAPAPRTRRS